MKVSCNELPSLRPCNGSPGRDVTPSTPLSLLGLSFGLLVPPTLMSRPLKDRLHTQLSRSSSTTVSLAPAVNVGAILAPHFLHDPLPGQQEILLSLSPKDTQDPAISITVTLIQLPASLI